MIYFFVAISQSLQTEYLQKLNEKRAERLREKEMESYQLQKTQKENAMYEEMMAEKRLQHQSKFIQDLEQQIKLKNMEKVSIRLLCDEFIWSITKMSIFS